MEISTIIGSLGGALTTIASIPQVIKTVKTKHTKDISLMMYILLTTGVALWLIYGIMISDGPIIISNGVTLALTSTILAYKIRYG